MREEHAAPDGKAADAADFTVNEAAPETDDEAIARLARLPALEYERVREAEAERIGCRVSMLDKQVRPARDAARSADNRGAGRGVQFPKVETWPEPVSLGNLLNDLVAAIRRHVVLSNHSADAAALWVAHTWVYEAFAHTPRLAITSPTKRCGKSTFLAILGAVCRRTLKADNISPSGVYRVVEAVRPVTLLLDEVDAFAAENEELRGVLNSGYERTGSVVRVVERDRQHEPVQFATFCPVALAAIGALPGTLVDRAVPLRMERKAAIDKLTRLREAGSVEALATLARKLSRWATDEAALLGTDPAIPDAMNDREGDISVPLLAIADLAGEEWPARARRSLLELFGLRAATEEGSEAAILLLADLRDIFTEANAERLPSADLCKYLGKMDHRPWSEWRHGKPMTPPQLATALRPFRVHSNNIKMEGGSVLKGYYRDHFKEAWARYLSDGNHAAGDPAPAGRYSATERRNPPFFEDLATATGGMGSASGSGEKPQSAAGCSGVADHAPRQRAYLLTTR